MDYDVCLKCNQPYEDIHCKPLCEECSPTKLIKA